MFQKFLRKHRAGFAPPPRKRRRKHPAAAFLPDVVVYPDPTPATYFFALLQFVSRCRRQVGQCRGMLHSQRLAVYELLNGTVRHELGQVRHALGQNPSLPMTPCYGFSVDAQGALQVQGHLFGRTTHASLQLLGT